MLNKSPVQCVRAAPNENNILEWHFVIHSLDDDRYRGGYYHGVIVFPSDYPYKPPSVKLNTPSGRFAINTKLCLSITDFHPESWNPLWSVSSILAAVVSFFVEDLSTYGSIRTSRSTKRSLAKKSLRHNVATSPIFRTLFPDLVQIHAGAKELEGLEEEEEVKDETESSNSACLSNQELFLIIFLFGILTASCYYFFVGL
jgi:ubiquitin-conjugating enzyme E2 J2